MAEPASFEELDRAIGNVLDAEITNFFELAEMLGLDPKQDFAGADLSGTDFFRSDLAGANFAGADLRGANLAYANLQEANLTNADLGILPSSYLARAKELNHLITLDPDRASALTNAIASMLDHDRVGALNLARILNQNHTRASTSAVALVLALASASARARELANTLNRTRDRTNTSASSLNRALVLALDRASDLDHDIALDGASVRVHDIIPAIRGGANFYRANLAGVVLDGANVEGAVMIGCTGLSKSEITNLKERGAVFEDFPGDRSEVRVPVPR